MPSQSATVGKKRSTYPDADDNRTNRPIKRRASTACQSCRSRKVRCNVLEEGPPCTNCRLDDVQCTISIGERRLGLSRGTSEAVFILTDHSARNTQTKRLSNEIVHGLNSVAEESPQLSYSITPYPEAPESNALIAKSPPRNFPGIVQSPTASVSQGRVTTTTPILPQWIKALPDRMNLEDAEYLEKKGAFVIPEPAVLHDLLSCFAQWIYPWSPVVHLPKLLQSIFQRDIESEKISLLLFQATMFCGVSFANLALLRKSGFQTRKEARKHYFSLCKLLYDFEYEDDRLVLVQALILMTYWHESADHQKDIWHWIGVAVALATSIGLHHDPSELKITSEQKGLRKRVWCSLLMRDRLVALAMRRRTNIQIQDSTVLSLTIDDFDIGPHSSISQSIRTAVPWLSDDDQQKQMATICIEMTKLCTIVGRILEVQYSATCIRQPSRSRDYSHTSTTLVLLPRTTQADHLQVYALEAMLATWISDLPFEISDEINDLSESKKPINLQLHRAFLALLYHTAVNVLYRPSILSHSSSGARIEMKSANQFRSMPADDQTRASAFQITQIITKLQSVDLLRYLPPTGVTALVHAAMFHLLNVSSKDGRLSNQSKANLALNIEALGNLQEVYVAAELAYYLLKQGISQLDVSLEETNVEHHAAEILYPSPHDVLSSSTHDVATGDAFGFAHGTLNDKKDLSEQSASPNNAMANFNGLDFDVLRYQQDTTWAYPLDTPIDDQGLFAGGQGVFNKQLDWFKI
jgi:hypothetical protein